MQTSWHSRRNASDIQEDVRVSLTASMLRVEIFERDTILGEVYEAWQAAGGSSAPHEFVEEIAGMPGAWVAKLYPAINDTVIIPAAGPPVPHTLWPDTTIRPTLLQQVAMTHMLYCREMQMPLLEDVTIIKPLPEHYYQILLPAGDRIYGVRRNLEQPVRSDRRELVES